MVRNSNILELKALLISCQYLNGLFIIAILIKEPKLFKKNDEAMYIFDLFYLSEYFK